MKTPKTGTLIGLGIGLMIFGSGLMRGVVVIHPAYWANGEIIKNADGSAKFESNMLDQFLVNWDAYISIIIAVFFFGWACMRGITIVYKRYFNPPASS